MEQAAKTRCLPGDRCLVIAEFEGCECNVGAHVTVDAIVPVPPGEARPPAWTFRDASRRLLALDRDPNGVMVKSWTDGEPHLALENRPVFLDEHLVPLRDLGGVARDEITAAIARTA